MLRLKTSKYQDAGHFLNQEMMAILLFFLFCSLVSSYINNLLLFFHENIVFRLSPTDA